MLQAKISFKDSNNKIHTINFPVQDVSQFRAIADYVMGNVQLSKPIVINDLLSEARFIVMPNFYAHTMISMSIES